MKIGRSVIMRLISILLLMSVLCVSVLTAPIGVFATNGCIIDAVYTDKAMYNTESTVTITVAIRNPGTSEASTTLNTNIYYLESNIWSNTINVTVPAGTTVNKDVTWTAPSTNYRGYLVKVDLGDGVYKTTAVDVSNDISRYPRYGFACDFPQSETNAESQNLMNELARDYHINLVQYYDWMWRHEKNFPSSTATSWQDLFGNTISKTTIQQRIDAGHAKNQKAMAYQMAYMAREGYESYGVDKAWGLYKNRYYTVEFNGSDPSTINNVDQLNFPLEGNPPPVLFAMNPQDTNWQNHIINEYKDAINTLSFDGIQVDQMGNFWGDINKYDYYGNYVDLGKTFSSLINNAKTQLTNNNLSKNIVTMNIVNGAVHTQDKFSTWDIVKNANTTFQFSEIWENSPSYNSLKNFVEWQKKNDGGKAIVLAAYMNQYDNAGTTYQAESASYNGLNQGTYDGTTYLTGFDTTGDYVSFTVNAPEAGSYALVFRCTNGGSSRARKSLYIDNNKVGTVNFDPTRTGMIPASPSWTSWSIENAFIEPKAVYLTSGTHTIKVQQDSGDSGDIWLDSLTLGTFNEPSVRLTDSVFAAIGAMHIEMGAGFSQANGPSNYTDAVMLAHPYYPKAFKMMRNSLKSAMKAHYNFITAYENLLYDPDITVGDGGLQNLTISGENVTGSGESGKIWFIPKNKGTDYGILHLINLTAENDTNWRNTTSEPSIKSNLAVKYYIPYHKSITNVYLASPEINGGITQSLSFTTGTNSTGKYVSFTVPSLKYWDMIYFKWGNQSEPSIYEAENSIKSNVGTNTDHAGYTGTGFVDSYGELYDSVTFDINITTEGYYTLKFRYANGTSGECSRELFIDNASAGKTTFIKLANWDTWGVAEKGVYLKPGRHRLVLFVTSTYGGYINLDNLVVEPLLESARSLYMHNWNDTVYIWKDTEVNMAQSLNADGPGIYEIRYSSNYNKNNVKNYSMFLRNETDGTKYMYGSKFRSVGYFGSDGVLYNEYKTYDGNTLSPQITRAFAVIPNQKFMVVKYTIKNTSGATKTYKILDMFHPNNISTNDISASYDSNKKTISINMSAAGQYYIAHGTLESTIDGYQIADDTISDTNNPLCSPWVTFNNNGTLKNNSSATVKDISTAFIKSVTLGAGASTDIYFYIAVAGSSSDLSSAINTVRGQTGSYWMSQMITQYTNWLNEGIRTSFSDSSLNTAYDRNLIAIKQSIVPGTSYGAPPAATNPSSYSYKVWARDSAVTAMALDASGHTAEADKYWYWLADRQITTDQGDWKKPGTFWTCYWLWDNSPVSFVEPEYDSIGMFLVGAYRHYKALSGSAQTTFLNNIWDAYKRSADWVMNNVQSNGFGAADCSIWEEQSEYNSFTQALYVAGLDAAQEMAKAKGLQSLADNYNGAAGTIRSAIQRRSTDLPKGLWNETDSNGRYFNRAVSTDGTANTKVDSSSDVLMIYGVADVMSKRTYDHYRKVTSTIQHDEYGIARYEGDTFYTGKNFYDPGGIEAFEDEPSWPQMSMWAACIEIYSGYDGLKQNALRRLKWYADRCATGYMAPGEAVSNVTLKPCISTMVEPITAASFIIASLVYKGDFDTRILPNQFNAGANATITVHGGCWDTSNQYDKTADWEQWKYIPYYMDKTGDNTAGDSTRDIKKVYIGNDANNIYIRVDNVGRSLPGYNETNNKFSIAVYSEDFVHGSVPTESSSLYGTSLGRGMSYMVIRHSDSENFVKYTASGSGWGNPTNITGVISPQWECNSGRIEMVIPKSALSSTGSIPDNSWANMVIMIGNNTGSGWSEVDAINIHYRTTGSGTGWMFGNSED